jgi:membrane dipeptidase
MNPTIQEAREVALSIIQPAQRELEHGLELHRDSIVIESYGFAPRASVVPETLEVAVKSGTSAVEIAQMCEEMVMTRMVHDVEEQRGFVAAFEVAGVDCILQNAGEEGNDIEVLLRRLGRFTYAIDMMPQILQRAATPDDILKAKKNGKRCLYLTTNGVPVPKCFRTTEEALTHIRTFFQLGVRMMHLTYNRRNLIGDGCAEARDGGLSDFGQAVITEMNQAGVIVDIAHSGVQTGMHAAKYSGKPVVISHATCAALSDHCRAKPDELIRAVADTGGIIGICCVPAFLQGSGDISAFLDHIDYAVKLVGADHVAIGTDVAAQCLPDERKSTSPSLPRSQRFESLWPKNDELFQPEWQQPQMHQSLAWTNWPLFTVGMVQRGYSDNDIQKILGGNILRVAREVLA